MRGTDPANQGGGDFIPFLKCSPSGRSLLLLVLLLLHLLLLFGCLLLLTLILIFLPTFVSHSVTPFLVVLAIVVGVTSLNPSPPAASS